MKNATLILTDSYMVGDHGCLSWIGYVMLLIYCMIMGICLGLVYVMLYMLYDNGS